MNSPYGAAVSCTRMKRAGGVLKSTLSRTFSVVGLLISTVVVAALKGPGRVEVNRFHTAGDIIVMAWTHCGSVICTRPKHRGISVAL